MQYEFYIDAFVVTNGLMDFLVLMFTDEILHRKARLGVLFLASVLGAVVSAVLFVDVRLSALSDGHPFYTESADACFCVWGKEGEAPAGRLDHLLSGNDPARRGDAVAVLRNWQGTAFCALSSGCADNRCIWAVCRGTLPQDRREGIRSKDLSG